MTRSAVAGADDWLDQLERSYGMPPLAVLPRLPESGIALARWRRGSGQRPARIRHALEGYTLSWLLRPMRAETWFGDKRVWSGEIGSEMFRITPPGVDLSWHSDDDFDFLLLSIPTSTIDRFGAAAGIDVQATLADLPLRYRRDDLARHLIGGMFDAAMRATPSAYALADALGGALVARLVDVHAESRRPGRERLSPQRLRRVKQHIRGHLDEKLSVGRLAAVAALSESHFARAFREETGLSPHHYVVAERVARAQALLRAGDVSILQIALDCGFSDASHFARAFRRTVGVSPMAYRFSHPRD